MNIILLPRPTLFRWSPTPSPGLPPVAARSTRRGRRVPPQARYAAVAIVALALTGCGKHEPATAAAPNLPSAQVQLTTARAQTGPAIVDITGTVRPVQRAVLAAKVMGAIEELPVTLGQSVRAGDVLVKIGAGEISAKLLQAQSQLNVARRDLERERDLLGKGASTADMVKGLEDRLAMTEAMVREAEVMLGYATVRAPFDGVVARKMVNAGDLAAPGVPLLEVEGTNGFQVEVGLPDSLAAGLMAGQPLSVEVPSTGVTFEAPIAELSSAADPSAHTVLAKISVPAGAAVRSGQFVRVQVPGAPVESLLVPVSAVSRFGQLERVFVADPANRAELRLVKTGATRSFKGQPHIEVLSGLDDGEKVVLAAPAGLREGQPLEVAP